MFLVYERSFGYFENIKNHYDKFKKILVSFAKFLKLLLKITVYWCLKVIILNFILKKSQTSKLRVRKLCKKYFVKVLVKLFELRNVFLSFSFIFFYFGSFFKLRNNLLVFFIDLFLLKSADFFNKFFSKYLRYEFTFIKDLGR